MSTPDATILPAKKCASNPLGFSDHLRSDNDVCKVPAMSLSDLRWYALLENPQWIWSTFFRRQNWRTRSAQNVLKTLGIDLWNNFNEKLYSSFFLNFYFFIAKTHFEEPGRKNLITFQISFRGNDFSFVNRLQRKNRSPKGISKIIFLKPKTFFQN